jgi:glycosyltransferase involved in cell wall biosynthesis
VPQPKIAPFAWRRRFVGQRGHSLCGLTHAIASHAAMDAIGAYLTAPVQPWDAVICTSRSVKATVDRILSEHGEFLRGRLGATDCAPKLMLPVIPLGVHCDQFAPSDREAQRARLRGGLGIGKDELAILFVGRLSLHAKAHPYPMYRALELASRRVSAKLHLIQAGWFASAPVERAFRDAAREIAPGVTHHFVDGRDPAARLGLWHAADVFCSLSDSVQETFGLTPVEAMAAGLPVVASDWDGYRETIEHGVQGILVPTYAPGGSMEDLAYRYAAGIDSYDHYLLHTSSAVAVDVEATATAFERLFEDPELRARMGAAGRRRARENYDWKFVIAAYAELWRELAEIRRVGEESCPKVPGHPSHPLRDDPFALFAGHAAHRVDEKRRVCALTPNLSDEIARLRALGINRPVRLIRDDLLAAICEALKGRDERTLSEILEGLPPLQHAAAIRTVLWLKKMGLITISPD